MAPRELGPLDESASGLRKLLVNGSVYAAGRAAQITSVILVLPLLTRVLGPSEYGRIAAALVVIQVLNVVGAAGLPVAITLEFFRGQGGPRRARALVLWTVLTGVALTVVAELSAPIWVGLLSSNDYLPIMRVAVLAIAPMAGLSAVQALLQAGERPGSYALVTVAGTAGAQALGLVLVGLTGARSTTYFAGMVLGVSLATMVGLLVTGTRFGRGHSSGLLGSALRDGLPTVPHDLALYLIVAGDRLVLERVAGPAAVGRYQVAYVVGTLGVTFVSALVAAWMPVVHGASAEARWRLLGETTLALYRVGALLAGSLAFAAPVLLGVMAPRSFDPLGLTFTTAVVALSVLPYVMVTATVILILQVRRAGVLAWVSPVSAAFNIALNAVLVPRYGMQASAVLTVVTFGFQAAVLRICARSFADVPWKAAEARRWWVLGLVLVAAGAALPTGAAWLVLRASVTGLIVVAIMVGLARVFRHGQPALVPRVASP